MEDTLQTALAIMRTTVARWEALAASLPASALTTRPAPAEWSAMECLSHMLDTESGVFPSRVSNFLAGEDIPNFDPDSQSTPRAASTPAAMVAEFATLRQHNLRLLSTLQPADIESSAIHSELGRVTLGQMLHEWAAHDLVHTMQAERALMQPFIAGCGPWRVYFAEHVIAP